MIEKFYKIFIAIIILGFSINNIEAKSSFDIVKSKKVATIIYDVEDYKTIEIVANLLADDIEMISGVRPKISTNIQEKVKGNAILIGSIEKSSITKKLISQKKIDLSNIKDGWEQYSWQFVKGVENISGTAMVITGSDKRGTAFGALDLSQSIGVSPWYWWADVLPEKQKNIAIAQNNLVSKEPTVKYRGIFLNDECWGLNPWSSKNFEQEENNIGPKTYAKIFELLLRLKANFIWPAMHPCTQPFYVNPDNPKIADEYGIVVGTSHAEPMLRNNVGEWKNNERGSFNFFTNRDNVLNYWDERVDASKNYESIYTLGMRGIHDSGMVGASSMAQQIEALEELIGEQRNMLSKYVNNDVTRVPQAFTAYKEVLDIYDRGLKLDDDITLVWPDDNYGYIQRLSNKEEQQRSGGSGIYYHISYWGRPHDYLWINSTHPSFIREEMIKAAWHKANDIWVVNVGDLKPHEYSIELFLDMAYNSQEFDNPGSEKVHFYSWYKTIFGDKNGEDIANLMWEYFNLNFERKPEFMGWSQTEPTRKTNDTEYNHFQADDEAQKRIDAFDNIAQTAKDIRKLLPKKYDDIYYQLVYYPVVNAGYMNKKILYLEKAYLYAKQGRASANDFAKMSKLAYDSILIETEYFNTKLSDGKWEGMMYHKPRSLPVFEAPIIPQWDFDNRGWKIATEGDEQIRRSSSIMGPMELPTYNKATNRKFFVDLFLSGNKSIKWDAITTDEWIKLSKHSGELTNDFGKKQERIWVSIDWDKIDKKGRTNGKITFKGSDDKSLTISVYTNDFIPENRSGDNLFYEENGYVSMYASNFSRANKGDYLLERLDGLGYSKSAIWTKPKNVTDEPAKVNPSVEYDFYAFRHGNITIKTHFLPTHPLNNKHKLRVKISINGEESEIHSFETFGRSEQWKLDVLSNRATIETKHRLGSSGIHTLKIEFLDPGIVLDYIEIDRGGLPKSYSILEESLIFK